MLHVPYKGASPALVDLLGGQIQAMFDNIPNVLNQIKQGKLRALCVTSNSRLAQLPDVPTISESGFSDAESTSFFALVAPKGTPAPVISNLNARANEALKDNNLRNQFMELGAIPIGMSPQQSSHYIELQASKWSKVVKQSGAKADL
jgi:tripartite-type tricarboxylate transporter receptor subunit TctC